MLAARHNEAARHETKRSNHTQQTSKTVTDSSSSNSISKQIFGYNLQGRMSSVINEGYDGSGVLNSQTRTSYDYDSKSYRIKLVNETAPNPDGNYSQLDSTVEFLAAADKIRGDLHAVAEGTFRIAETTAENSLRASLAAADIALWNTQETARVTAHTSIDTDLQTDWSQYLVDAATARSSWWTTASAQYANLATDRNSADSVYALRMQTAQVDRSQAYVLAVETQALAVADTLHERAVARADSVRDFYVALELPAETYADGTAAQAIRDRDVGNAQAERDYFFSGDGIQRAADLQTVADDFAADQQTLDSDWLAAEANQQADKYTDLAVSNFDQSLDLIAADVQFETTRTNSEATYVNEESDAYLQATTSWAGIDAVYRQYEANTFAAAATGLASTNGSPWAGFDGDFYTAQAARVASVSSAHQTQMIAKAGAQKDVEIGHTGAETTWHLASINGSGARASALPTADQTLAGQLSTDYAASGGTGNPLPQLATPPDLQEEYTLQESVAPFTGYWTDQLDGFHQTVPPEFGFTSYGWLSTLSFDPQQESWTPPSSIDETSWGIDRQEEEARIYDLSLEYRYDWLFETESVTESTPDGALTASYDDSASTNPFDAAAFNTRATGSGQSDLLSTGVTDGTEYRQEEISQILSASHLGETSACNTRQCHAVRSEISDRPEFSLDVYAGVYTSPAELAAIDHVAESERANSQRLAELLKQRDQLNPSAGQTHRSAVSDDNLSLAAAKRIASQLKTSSFSTVFDRSSSITVLDILDGAVGGIEGFAKGFFGDGRKGNIEFAGSILAWRAKTDIVGILFNNYRSFFLGGYQQAFDAYAAPVQAIDKAVGFAGKYGPIVKQMASDVALLYSREYLRAVADEDQSTIRRLEDKWARSVSPDTAMVLKMAGPPIDQISKKIDSLDVEDLYSGVDKGVVDLTWERWSGMVKPPGFRGFTEN